MSATPRTSPWPVLGVFVLLAFLFSGVLGAFQSAIDSEALTLAQFGPALGALVTWTIFRRRLKALLPEPVAGRQVGAHTVLMVAAVAVFAAIAAAFALGTGQDLEGVAAVGGVPFVLYLLLQLVGAAGEEIGWRGFMQPLLERRTARFAAAALTGVVWALWHVQIFAAAPLVAVAFLVSTVAFAILLGYMGNGSLWQRTATAAVGHWLINVTLHVIAGDQVNEAPQAYFTAVAAAVTTAVFVLLFARARAARERRRETAAAGA
jgi:membrane protease YdiL (CAAX protease family)